MDKYQEHIAQVKQNVRNLAANPLLGSKTLDWMLTAGLVGAYPYNFEWCGRPIIQYPQDVMIMQELIWMIKPDVIIETGIAHGGSLMLSASMLALLDYADAVANQQLLDPYSSKRKVLAIDIDIRSHNRAAIEAHPLAHKITMFEGSSIDPDIIEAVKESVADAKKVLVCLDSNHTHEHVLAELKGYTPMVTSGSYCVVFDTLIEDIPAEHFNDRPWHPGNSPKTAVHEFLRTNTDFIADTDIDAKLQITVAPNGFLRRL